MGLMSVNVWIGLDASTMAPARLEGRMFFGFADACMVLKLVVVV